MKRVGKRLISSFLVFVLFIGNATIIHAEESQYAHSDEASSGGVTLKVEWNDPVLGQETTFHVSATGGSGNYKFRMEAPSYTDPDVLSYESVADPSRGEWLNYTEECSSHDYTFTMMASGTYNFRFYVMDNTANMNFLRTNTFIQVSSPNYPSVNSIVQSAVAQCNAETDGSDYAKALWLHDWLLNQLDYDKSLKWSSAESALTRGLGTCQSYESAYSKLLTAAGIENTETRDTYDGHTWNAFKIDGEWYQVDCTWDDSNDDWCNFDERRLYFGLTDELMSIAHPGHAKIYNAAGYATRSTSLANNYFVKSGEAAKWVASYKDRIQENLNAGKTQFSITADNAAYPPSVYGIQNGIIAYVMNTTDWYVNGKKVDLVAKTNGAQFDFTVPCTEHKWDEGKVTTEPTCEKEGIKTYTCKNCQTTKTESIKALGHNYSNEWTIDKEDTCQEDGGKSHHCIRCDDKKDVTTIPKTDHHFDNGVITKQATTTETGLKTYTCQDCKTTKTEIIPIIKNNDTVDSESPIIDVNSIKLSTKSATTGDTVKISIKITYNISVDRANIQLINYDTGKIIGWTNLTYNEKMGLYEYSLEITDAISNGHWYIDNIQAYDAVNNVSMESFKRNEYGFIVSNTKADSETPVIDVSSIKLSTKSAITGDTVKISIKITDNISVNRANIQLINYDTGKIIGWTNLTYNEKMGLYEYSLEITDAISNGHWYIDNIQAYDAVNNVSMESFNHYECFFIVTRNNGDVHKWNNGTILQQPTCTKIGETIFECSVCHETKTETIKALGHDYSNNWTIDKTATCTQEGSKSHHCIRCNDKKDVTVIPKTGHNWDAGVVTTKATCTKDGVKTYTCKDCKYTKTEVIKALGHDYSSSWTIDKAATCTNEGSKSHHCSRCDSKKDVTVIPKTGHSWDKGTIVKNPTYSETGIKRFTCTKCGNTKDEVIAVLVDKDASILYKTHVQDIGWQDFVQDGKMSGTSGRSKRLEGIQIKLSSRFKGNVEYQTHVQDIGWQGWKSNGAMSGTSGKSKRLEAIRIKLTGEIANKYDVYYRVHCQDFGWLGWAKNGESSGSEGCSKRLEAIEIRLVRKGEKAPGSTNNAFIRKNNTVESASISYRTHVQDYGWQNYVSDGKQSGISGKSKRLEGINIKISSTAKGSVVYRTHVQDYGWQSWKQNNEMSGTQGKSKRLEAIQIKLTGDIANKYDVYYRVHCQDFGWLGWAKNGESSGSEGYSKRLEAIEIRLVPKGQRAPGNTNNKYYKK